MQLRRRSSAQQKEPRPQELPRTFAMLPAKARPSSCLPPRASLVLVPQSARLPECTYVDLLCLFLDEIVCLTGYFAGRCLPTCRPGSSSPESDLSYRCASAVHVVRRHAKSLRITPDSTQQEQSFNSYVLSVLGMKRNFLDFVGVALLLLRESQSTVGRKRKSTSHWQNSSASDSKAFT